MSHAYVRSARLNLKKFTDRMKGNITDITTADINRFLGSLEGLGPVSRNTIRRNLIPMFSFAKKQGYLHPDRKTSAELSESFKEHSRVDADGITPAPIEQAGWIDNWIQKEIEPRMDTDEHGF